VDAFDAGIATAADGFSISSDLAGTIARRADDLRADPGLAAVYLADGVPGPGAVLVQDALGRTLRTLADAGGDALASGPLAEGFVDGLRAIGVPISIEDLAAHTAELAPALRGRYGDLDVSVSPPPSQGFVLLEALAAVERLGVDPDPLGPDAARLALVLHAASADRDRHLADPEAMTLHVSALLDDGHLATVCDLVRSGLGGHTGAAAPGGPPGRGDTVALMTADADGWGVSLIQSLSDDFGAAILEPSTGIAVHNRGAEFSLDPEHPNVLAPGKKPAHTLMPVAVHRDGRLVAMVGTRGGYAQPQIDLMVLVRAFDLGLDAGAAVSEPRWLVGGMSPLGDEPWVLAEASVPDGRATDLRDEGFRVETCGPRDRAVGHAQLVLVAPDGLSAGSDPRADPGALAS
jgi:gamma-glutamyltranspeptidase/glutathione hydrolase